MRSQHDYQNARYACHVCGLKQRGERHTTPNDCMVALLSVAAGLAGTARPSSAARAIEAVRGVIASLEDQHYGSGRRREVTQ